MFSSLAVIATVAAVAAAATNSTGYSNTNINYPYVLTAAQIAATNSTLLYQWCEAQQNSCPQICGGQAYPNTCTAATLDWSCTCVVGTTPNITLYEQTIPFFECQQYKANCVLSTDNAYDQGLCNAIACGSIDPVSVAAAASSSAAIASTATTTAAAAASTSAASASTTGSTAAAATTTAAAATTATSAAAAAATTTKASGASGLTFGSASFAAGLLAVLGFAL